MAGSGRSKQIHTPIFPASLRGSRVATTVIIISQEPLGAVKSTTARSRDLTTIEKYALLKFPFVSPYTRQISSSYPEDLRRGPTCASLRVSRLSRDSNIGTVLDSGFVVMTKSRAPAGGSNYPENGLVKPPRLDTRALSPAGMFGGKAPLRLAAQKSRPYAPSVSMRSAPAYFLCKWGA